MNTLNNYNATESPFNILSIFLYEYMTNHMHNFIMHLYTSSCIYTHRAAGYGIVSINDCHAEV